MVFFMKCDPILELNIVFNRLKGILFKIVQKQTPKTVYDDVFFLEYNNLYTGILNIVTVDEQNRTGKQIIFFQLIV